MWEYIVLGLIAVALVALAIRGIWRSVRAFGGECPQLGSCPCCSSGDHPKEPACCDTKPSTKP